MVEEGKVRVLEDRAIDGANPVVAGGGPLYLCKAKALGSMPGLAVA